MFTISILFVLVAGSYALVCTPETCMMVRCAAVTAKSCPDGVIKDDGGFCGCCPACIRQLDEGSPCETMLFLGVPASAQCGDGLYCDVRTHTCQKRTATRDLGPCAVRFAEVEARLANDTDHMLLGLERPKCDENGDYLGMQISGSQAFCVTKDGTLIDGYSVYRWLTGGDMDCQCARDQYAYMQTGLRGKLFNCDANGNYASVGCLGSVCYCQDKTGQPVGDTKVHIGQQNMLNC